MKRLALVLIASLSLLFSPSQATVNPISANPTINRQTVIYRTKTGKKYHRGDCSYLRQSKIQITIKQAIAEGLTPCSRCKP